MPRRLDASAASQLDGSSSWSCGSRHAGLDAECLGALTGEPAARRCPGLGAGETARVAGTVVAAVAARNRPAKEVRDELLLGWGRARQAVRILA